MKSYIENDPLSLVGEAFSILYPDLKYRAAYDTIEEPEMFEDGVRVAWGSTQFDEELGALVLISPALTIADAAEIFAHELAHVAVDDADHGKEWENAFNAIFEKYNELGDQRFNGSISQENLNNGGEE